MDDAFSSANREAAAGRWSEAATHYEKRAAGASSPAACSYDLGTAYAQQGELGRATFHLRQALDFRGNPTAQLVEAARTNLAIVRRRAELRAATTNAIIDSPQSWWDLVVETLRAPGVGWVSLVSGFVALCSACLGPLQRAARCRDRPPRRRCNVRCCGRWAGFGC
ncbi:MAG: hypothetical protein U0168_04805 [Nannocystaceae bacterium]